MSERSPRVAINESVIHAEFEDEAMLLNVESGVYFGLDGVGTRVWELLAESPTEEEIISQLLTEFEADPAQLRADVTAFLQLLAFKGLIREVRE